MRVVYIRVTKGLPTEPAQREALTAAGVEPDELAEAWVDRQVRKARPGENRFQQRDYMLGAVRAGDEVWVARPAVIGAAEADILDFLSRMTEQGGVLCVASTGGRHRYHPDVHEALKLVQDVRADERAAVMAKARRGVKKPAGKQPIGKQRIEAARAVWFDATITAEDASTRTGIGVRTLYRYFGERGTPAFGRPKKRR